MRVVGHPGVLAVVLAGLLLWGWSLVEVVPAWQWLAWFVVAAIVVVVVSRRELTDLVRRSDLVRRLSGSRVLRVIR